MYLAYIYWPHRLRQVLNLSRKACTLPRSRFLGRLYGLCSGKSRNVTASESAVALMVDGAAVKTLRVAPGIFIVVVPWSRWMNVSADVADRQSRVIHWDACNKQNGISLHRRFAQSILPLQRVCADEHRSVSDRTRLTSR